MSSGKVYLKRNLDIKLKQEESTFGKLIKFKKNFRPLAAEIVPISKQRKSKDFELAQHLKHLLANNENGSFGNIQIAGEIRFFKSTDQRPSETETRLQTCHLDMSLKGNFPWFFNTLQNEGSCASYEVQLENVLAVAGQRSVVTTFSNLKEYYCAKDLFKECKYLSYSDEDVKFTLNAATWDLIFQAKRSGRACPKLSLVVCANISERMAQSLLIVGPYGSCYTLTPYQSKLKNERQQDVTGGIQPDAVIVGQSGKEWQVQSKHLIEGSPVFQAMLEKPNFEEGRTKRVNLSDLEDKTVECLLAYINYFSMVECLNNVGLGIKMLEVADRFQINGLTKALEEMLIRRSNINPSEAIQLFSYVRRLEHFHLLKCKSLLVLHRKKNEWENSEEFKQLFREEPDLAWDLMTSAFQDNTSEYLEIQRNVISHVQSRMQRAREDINLAFASSTRQPE